MKKYLLPQAGNFYKANLHCHSTYSDGAKSPAEIKEMYMAEGYSAVAFTDHEVYIPHNDLTDDHFVALNGMELSFESDHEDWEIYPWRYTKVCHVCAIAEDPMNHLHPCWNRNKPLGRVAATNKHLVKFDESQPDYHYEYSVECVNKTLKLLKEKGFFTTYNHPTWSLENPETYLAYNDFDALEIYNHSSFCEGFDDYNPHVYEQFLRKGKRIGCVASDDNHNWNPQAWDSFGGFAMIKAEKLDYASLMQALKKGDYYASQGPKIHELWYEDGKICVTCDDALKIDFATGRRHGFAYFGKDGGPINHACFPLIEGDPDPYVRVTVTGFDRKVAHTRAYWMDEILPK